MTRQPYADDRRHFAEKMLPKRHTTLSALGGHELAACRARREIPSVLASDGDWGTIADMVGRRCPSEYRRTNPVDEGEFVPTLVGH
jgi:hypothetical protein